MSTRLHAALNALNGSFKRLEEAAAASAVRGEQATNELDTALTQAAAENNFLKEDNLRLSNQLQALQKDFLKLQEASVATVNRLDDSIKAIDLMLEGTH